MDCYRIRYEIRYLQSYDIVFLIFETEITYSCSEAVSRNPFGATIAQPIIIIKQLIVFVLSSSLHHNRNGWQYIMHLIVGAEYASFY